MTTRDRIAAVFRGPSGIRPGWRLLIFFVLAFGIIGLAFGLIVTKVLRVQELEAWTPTAFLLAESVGGLGIVVTLSAAAIMSRIERRPIGGYGLPWREAFRGRFWEGALWGLGAVIGLIALIGAAGGVSLGGWALSGAALWQATLGWAAAMTLLGLAEEFAFRGYALVTLAEGIQFWPAAGALSLVFGGLHYFFKHGDARGRRERHADRAVPLSHVAAAGELVVRSGFSRGVRLCGPRPVRVAEHRERRAQHRLTPAGRDLSWPRLADGRPVRDRSQCLRVSHHRGALRAVQSEVPKGDRGLHRGMKPGSSCPPSPPRRSGDGFV